MEETLYRSVSQEQHSFYTSHLNSRTWRLLRREVLKRDNHECQTCCATGDLEVHHKHYRNLGNEDMKDLIALCVPCHEAITSSIRFRRNTAKGVIMMLNLEDRLTEFIETRKERIAVSGLDPAQKREAVKVVKPRVAITDNV